jgi:predicted enzyme related to lactoylglutathione lyase
MAEDWARPVVHWELQARDADRIEAFYKDMFNWNIKGEGRIRRIDAGIGGPEPGPGGHIMPGDASRVVLYIQVRDLRESMERAKSLGGSVTREPLDLPNGPTIAGIADPEGNPVVLVQQ